MKVSLRFLALGTVALGVVALLAPACESGATDSDNDGTTTATGSTSGAQPACGDRITDASLGEECDDGNSDETDDCLTSCKKAKCGDGNVRDGYEDCDDGNTFDTDACTSECVGATCGDSFVWAGQEACDDGNEEDGDACTSECVAGAGCGNAKQEIGEECDDGNKSNADACTNVCKRNVCGDGYARIGVEECDDNNQINNDTCSNMCTNNPVDTYKCPGTPVTIGSQTGVSVGTDLALSVDSNTGSCGGDGSDVVYAVKPEQSGVLHAELKGEVDTMDAVLYIREQDCEAGPELACVDGSLGGGTESAVVPVMAGNTYYVFADLYDPIAVAGNVSLSLSLATEVPGDDCPGLNVPIQGFNMPVSVPGTTAVAMADRTGTGLCSSPGSKDVVLQITPPFTGRLAVAVDPSFDASVYARTACTAPAAQVDCSETAGVGGPEAVLFDVVAGTTYYVIIDGHNGTSGSFTAEVTLLMPQ